MQSEREKQTKLYEINDIDKMESKYLNTFAH